MAEPIMAFLFHETRLRPTCLGCSRILWEQGMLVISREHDASISNAPPNTYSILIYEIAPLFSLEECREAISARHAGERWGE